MISYSNARLNSNINGDEDKFVQSPNLILHLLLSFGVGVNYRTYTFTDYFEI